MRKGQRRQGRRFIGLGGKDPSPANPESVSFGNVKHYDLPKEAEKEKPKDER